MQTVEESKLSTKQKIVLALAAMGYSSRYVSVSLRPCTYSFAVTLTIREVAVSYKKIDQLSKQFEKIDRDPRSGEILSGGNTFVDVKISDQVRKTWAEAYLPKILAAKDRLRGWQAGEEIDSRFVLYKNGNYYKVWDNELHDGRGGWLDMEWCHFEDLAIHLFTLTQTTPVEKLIKAIEKAKVKAQELEGVDDFGTCNLDTVVIKLLKWKQADIVAVSQATGCRIGDPMTGFWANYRFLFTPVAGQGNRRSAMARAAYESLKADGFDVNFWQQID